MNLRRLPLEALAIGVILLAGAYQVMLTVNTFSKGPVGTKITSSINAMEYISKMQFLYCHADWINFTALETMGLGINHAWLIAVWVEILTGMPEDTNVYQFTPNLDLPHKLNTIRTIFYLQEISKFNRTEDKITKDWVKAFGRNAYEEDYEGRVDRTDYWNFETPTISYDSDIILGTTYNSTINTLEDYLNEQNVSFIEFLQTIANRPTDMAPTDVQFRYGMACTRFQLRNDVEHGLTYEHLRNLQKHLIWVGEDDIDILKASVMQAGVHVTGYLGNIPPVIGGDDYNLYRKRALYLCISGGYVANIERKHYTDDQLYDSMILRCLNYCVDPRVDYLEAIGKVVGKAGLHLGYVSSKWYSGSECNYIRELMTGRFDDSDIDRREESHGAENENFHVDDITHMNELRRKRLVPEVFGHRSQQDVLAVIVKQTTRLSSSENRCVHVERGSQLPAYYFKSRCRFSCRDQYTNIPRGCTILPLLLENGSDMRLCKPHEFFMNRDTPIKEDAQLDTCLQKCEDIVPCKSIEITVEKMNPTLTDTENISLDQALHRVVIIPSGVTLVEEYEVLPWETFVANVGGLLGMFCGFSLIGTLRCVSERSKVLKQKRMAERKALRTGLGSFREGVKVMLLGDQAVVTGPRTESPADAEF